MVRDYGRKLYTIMAVSFIITILFSGAAMAQEAAKAGQQKEAQKDEMKGDQKSDQKSEIKGELQIPEERRYVVKEGDTLWDISNNTLKDPFLWPRLWKDNKYIINPDLIYPGNIIMFPGEDKGIPSAPTAEAPKAAAPEQRPGEAPQPVMGEAAAPPPAVEEEVIAEAPAAVEETKERPIAIGGVGVLTDEVLLFSSGLIVPKLENKGVIIGSWDKKVLLGDNDIIYIDKRKNPSIANGDKYTIYKVVRQVKHPATEKKIGYLVKILGVVQITDVKKDVATGTIIRSFDTMEYGDRLMPYKKTAIPGESEKGGGNKKLKGYIVDVKDEKIQNAQLDIVYIDRGTKDGVMVGDRFVVVRPGLKTSKYGPGGGLRLPGQIVGELSILSVQEKTATAKILNSVRSVTKGDFVESK
jgi:hypothetical protein